MSNIFDNPFNLAPGQLGSMQGQLIDPELPLRKAAQEKKDADAAAAEKARLAPPPIDPRYQQLFEGQEKMARDFRNNIPQLADTFMGQIAEVNKKNLATQIDQTQKNYNKRGLLYSTARIGAEGADKTAAASDLAQKRSDLNSRLYSQADDLDQNAINTGFNLANQGQNIAGTDTKMHGQYLDMALEKQRRDMNALSGLGKGVGGAIGYAGGYLNGRNNGTGDYGRETGPGFPTINPVQQPATTGFAQS